MRWSDVTENLTIDEVWNAASLHISCACMFLFVETYAANLNRNEFKSLIYINDHD